jgi:hypothetical protein
MKVNSLKKSYTENEYSSQATIFKRWYISIHRSHCLGDVHGMGRFDVKGESLFYLFTFKRKAYHVSLPTYELINLINLVQAKILHFYSSKYPLWFP